MIRRNRGEKKREEDKEIEVNIDRAARDRDETFALLKRLDERKTVMEIKKVGSTTATPRPRGIGKYELKNLQSSLNQQVEGSRTKGRFLSLAFK